MSAGKRIDNAREWRRWGEGKPAPTSNKPIKPSKKANSKQHSKTSLFQHEFDTIRKPKK